MLAIAWWGWALIIVGALVALFIAALLNFRRGVRRDFIAYLREVAPEIQVLQERHGFLLLRQPNGNEGPFFLGRLYTAISQAPANDVEARKKIFDCWVGMLKESGSLGEELTLEKDGDRIFPRLIVEDFLRQLPKEGPGIPHMPLNDTGLLVAYVLDFTHSVSYLTDAQLQELGLDLPRLHERAMQNLRRISPPALIDRSNWRDGVCCVQMADTYDAARLLLIPEQLKEGQELAAVVPDRDILILLSAPPDGNWDSLRKLPRTPQCDRPLLDRPIKVTREGFAAI